MIGSGKGGGDSSGRSASDAELVHATRRGDKRAFVEIVARHQAMVCGIALGILGDFAASEDAGQEAFLTAWRKFHELREPERLRGWLGQIARNAALGHLRRRHGHDALIESLELVDQSPTPDEVTANEEEAGLVRESLAKLPEMYRLPLILFYREGQSVRAVAEALGISEDAVKQRLARGREMLRDRMSGLIETVLTRTGPTAVFTMAIAAAIGALAAPAVVAGTIFAAASSTSTTAASTTSILTVMSTSKTLLVTTALVAVVCVPIGYQLSSGKQPSVEPKIVAETNGSTKLAPPNTAPNFEGSALFAEWRELHNKYGTNAQAMPAIFKAIAEMKDAFRRRAFRAALVSEWVQIDPISGLAFFTAKGSHSEQRRQFFEEWLARDAQAAVNALMTSKPGWEEMARGCLSEIARRMPSRVAEIASRLPKAESYWDTSVRDAFGILAGGDLASARKGAEGITGPSREQALSGIARVWARSDVDAAIAWAKKLPEGTDRDEVIRAALMGKAAVDPVGALELVGTVPSGGRHAYSTTTTGARVLSEAAGTDFDGTLAFVTAHPGRFSRADMEGLNSAVTERLNADAAGFLSRCAAEGSLTALLSTIDTALLNNASGQRMEIWEWLKKQPETEGAKELRQSVLRGAGYQDPALAMRLIADVPPTADGDSQLKDLARALFNGGYRLHRFENVFKQAPERLRQPLLDAAYEFLNAGNLDDPQRWVDRLSLLPEGSRTRGIESIARAWAQQSPEEAFGWASSLTPGAARNGAVGAIATTWAKQDAYGAADWVASLPPGEERDHSAGSLVFAVAEKFPREAWEWALSIGDDLERSRAAAHAAQMMAARDLAMARQWVQTGPFAPEVRTQLQADLERRSRSATLNSIAQ
jgi:RNA polymerase sigma factor (sigma-70 family)